MVEQIITQIQDNSEQSSSARVGRKQRVSLLKDINTFQKRNVRHPRGKSNIIVSKNKS